MLPYNMVISRPKPSFGTFRDPKIGCHGNVPSAIGKRGSNRQCRRSNGYHNSENWCSKSSICSKVYLKRKEKTLRKQNIKSPRAIHAARAKQDTFGDGRLRPWCRRLQLDETCVLSDCGPFTPLCELKTTSSTKPEVYIALPPEKDRGTATDNVQKIWLNLHI